MRNKSSLQACFFDLVKAGLWEKTVRLSEYESIDYTEIYQLAEGQSLTGLIAAGIEHVEDVKLPQEATLNFVGAPI